MEMERCTNKPRGPGEAGEGPVVLAWLDRDHWTFIETFAMWLLLSFWRRIFKAQIHGIMGSPEPNKISQVWPHPDCKYIRSTTPGLQIRVVGCRVAVPHSYWSAVPTPLFIYISQLLRDSFSVSQQPPIWEPPSHYSMGLLHDCTTSPINGLQDQLPPVDLMKQCGDHDSWWPHWS